MKINLSPKFTVMVTAHRKTGSYLHHFKIIESPECPCANGGQTVNHLLFDCSKLDKEREKTNCVHLKRRQLAGKEE
jgi:hypothetical protein